MELHILMGRACAGKSRRVLEEIAARRSERGQVLLVPEHASHEAELDLCRACGPTASRDAEVLSFRSLATRVLSRTGGLADVTLDAGGKLLTMRRALQEVSGRLTVFARPSQRPAFLRQLVALADELYAYQVRPETLLRQVEDIPGAAGDKLRSAALVFAAYDARLHGSGFDVRSRVQKLCDALPEDDYLAGKDVYVDGFSYFNRVEEDILTTVLRQAHSLTVTLLGDMHEVQLFQNAIGQRYRLERMAKDNGAYCEVEHLVGTSGTALGHLERHCFGETEVWHGGEVPIRLYQANTAFSEVEYVSSQLRRLARQGVRWRDMGVAARNMEVYGPLLEAVFRRDDIPAYISRRSDILDKPVLTLLLSAVDAVTGGFEYEDVFRCLKTGMTSVTGQECDLLENYAIRWEIRGQMWLRDVDWTACPDGYGLEMTPHRQEQLSEVNRVRRKVRALFLQLSDGLKEHKTAKGKAEVLYTFAELAGTPEILKQRTEALQKSGDVQSAEEYAQLWHIFCQVLDQFVERLGDTELDGEEFARLLRLTLSQYAVATIPATLDQVKASPLTRNDRHPVRHLFLLGANDSVLPTVSANTGLLDGAERELLQQQQQGIALADADFDDLSSELQNIYAALAQPTESLTVTWPAGDETGARLLPSFVVARIRQLFPTVQVEKETGGYRRELPAAALTLAGRCPEGALWRFFRENGQGAVLDRMAAARSMGRGRLSPEAVRSLYGGTVAMSASRLDKVKTCHFGYFMEYGLRARERKTAKFEAPEIGTFLHYLLENVLRELENGEGIGRAQPERLRALVARYTEQYIAAVIDGYGDKSARFRYLFSRLRETACTIVENAVEEMQHSDFRPVAFELGFGGRDGQLPAITVTEGDTTLSVTGKVDRVDGWLKDGRLYLRVMDYKTGKKSFDLADVRYGLGIQMLLYLFALQKSGGAYFGRPVEPAGVLYLPARDVILRADRAIPPEKLQASLRRELRRSGMVLAEPDVLAAMEHEALESPCFLPMGISRDGTISGSLASAVQLGKLGRYVDDLLHRVAYEIGAGSIDADPCVRGPQESACDRCAFASACWFDERRDKPRYLQKTTPEEFWALVDQEVSHG